MYTTLTVLEGLQAKSGTYHAAMIVLVWCAQVKTRRLSLAKRYEMRLACLDLSEYIIIIH